MVLNGGFRALCTYIAMYTDVSHYIFLLRISTYVCVHRLFLVLNFAVNSEQKTTRNTVSIEVESIEGQQIIFLHYITVQEKITIWNCYCENFTVKYFVFPG